MTPSPGEQPPARPLRLWPGVAAVLLQWAFWFGLPFVLPQAGAIGLIGGFLFGLAVVLWWLLFSRVPWRARLGALVILAAALAATRPLIHPSIAGGAMGMMFWIQVVPGVCLALVAWAVLSRSLSAVSRWLVMAALLLAACAFWTSLRTDGITGEGRSLFDWRWTPTAEQQLLAQPPAEPASIPLPAAAPAPAPEPGPARPAAVVRSTTPILWPGFRGPHRDGIVADLTIGTDWTSSPPVELWRRKVGPGWSSFAIGGGLLFTQEQRGEFELVSSYDAATGKPIWIHRDAARFYESNAGAGPRGTPTLHDGRLYSLGATGILNALDAATGAVIWTRNAAADTRAKLPIWAFSGSPLVVDDLLIVSASGRLAAYDRATGAPRWMKTEGGDSYVSPHYLMLGGLPQVVFLNNDGAVSVAPADGRVLWQHPWPGAILLQPARVDDTGILLAAGDMMGGVGIRRLALTPGPSGWAAAEQWTTKGLKPYFNDFVVHAGHAYGFDGSILACISLQDGQRKWKGGRYGNGQMLLLPDQDLLLVTAEEGDLVLVAATPEKFAEIARVPALTGKTWNHPALAAGILYVRNGEEMAAFRLPPKSVTELRR